MTELTIDVIRAAQQDDLAAKNAIYEAFADFFAYRGRHYATTNGRLNAELAEDFAQEAAVAVLSKLPSFRGETKGQFVRWVTITVNGVLDKLRIAEANPGVPVSTAAMYEQALAKVDYDFAAAEAYLMSGDRGNKRLDREYVIAARTARMATVSLDAPVDDDTTLRDAIADTMALAPGDVSSADVDTYRRNAARMVVEAILEKLSPTQALVLRAEFGIDPIQQYPTTKEGDAELARDYGLAPNAVSTNRAKAHKRAKAVAEELFGGDYEAALSPASDDSQAVATAAMDLELNELDEDARADWDEYEQYVRTPRRERMANLYDADSRFRYFVDNTTSAWRRENFDAVARFVAIREAKLSGRI